MGSRRVDRADAAYSARGRTALAWVGVLSGPNNPFLLCWALLRGRTISVSGYAVDPKLAVSLLAEKHPAAAQWWRANTPKLIASGRAFIFDTEACEIRSA